MVLSKSLEVDRLQYLLPGMRLCEVNVAESCGLRGNCRAVQYRYVTYRISDLSARRPPRNVSKIDRENGEIELSGNISAEHTSHWTVSYDAWCDWPDPILVQSLANQPQSFIGIRQKPSLYIIYFFVPSLPCSLRTSTLFLSVPSFYNNVPPSSSTTFFLSQTIHLMVHLPAKLSNRLRTRMFPQNTSLLAGIAYSSSLSRLSILASRVLHFFLVRTLVFIDRHRSRKIPASVVSRFSRVCHSYQTMS